MKMRQHDDIKRRDIQSLQTAINIASIEAGVDQHRRALARAHHECIALAHVAGDQDPVRHRPAPGRREPRRQQHEHKCAGKHAQLDAE